MKKFVSAFLAISICTFSVPCLAAPIFEGKDAEKMGESSFVDDMYFDRYQDNGALTIQDVDALSSDSSLTLQELNTTIENRFNANELTPKAEKDALDISNTAKKLLGISDSSKATRIAVMATTADTKYSNEQLLRSANYIETILDLNEGISEARMSLVLAYANTAKTASVNAYPNNTKTQDAYRHFSWNYLMAKNINTTIARTAGNNHEWGLAILPAVLSYHNNMYNQYISQGYSTDEAARKALASTIFYIPGYKYDAYSVCASSLNNFKLIFTNSEYVMDLWNNCYGRAYKSSSSYSSAWTTATNSNELILSPTSVTNTHWNNVWSWDWYSY